MFINIVIPVCSLHIKYIEKCIESIKYQTRQPNLIIFVLNEYTKFKNRYDEIIDKYDFENYMFIKIDTWEKAGSNRNIGSKYANLEGIIIYQDVDDLMHIQRCEMVEKCFEKYSCSLLLHLSYQDYQYNNQIHDINNFKIILPDEVNNIIKNVLKDNTINFAYYFGNTNNKNKHSSLHHGQCCVLGSLIKDNLWSNDLHSGEDIKFVSDMTRKYENTLILLVPLIITVGRENIRLVNGKVCQGKKMKILDIEPEIK